MSRAQALAIATRELLTDLDVRATEREQQRVAAEDRVADLLKQRGALTDRLAALPLEIERARVALQVAKDSSLEGLAHDRQVQLETEQEEQRAALSRTEAELAAAQETLEQCERTRTMAELEDAHERDVLALRLQACDAEVTDARRQQGEELLDAVRSGARAMQSAVEAADAAAADARKRQDAFREEARTHLASFPAALAKAEALLCGETRVERVLRATIADLAAWEECLETLETHAIANRPIWSALTSGSWDLPAAFQGQNPQYFERRRRGVEEMLTDFLRRQDERMA